MSEPCIKQREDLKIPETSRIFKALGDPNRLSILEILMKEEKCACELLAGLDIGQSTLSHHMKILAEAGLVTCRRVGKWTHYTLDRQGWTKARQAILTLTDKFD